MTGNEDLERQDDHLTKAAALALLECGVEVDADSDGEVYIDLQPGWMLANTVKTMTPFQARLLAEALIETALRAEGRKAQQG